MASLVEQVQRAKTPREAILILAAAIDELRQAQPTDPWQDWGDDSDESPGHGLPIRSESSPEPRREITDDEAIGWIGRNYGRVPEDDAEGRALVAWVKRELEASPGAQLAEDMFTMGQAGIVESEIDFAPQDEQHRAEREAFARDVLQLNVALGDPPEGQEPWEVLYGKGGPMWFYIPSRELLMDYPDHVKQTMVEDLERYDHKVAYEFAYDVLKSPMIKDQNSPAMRVAVPTD